jgi:hypothetical protein
MTSGFDLIADDFRRELNTIKELLRTCHGDTGTPTVAVPVRIASSNASMLLLGASYEEFIRELVREYAAALIHGEPPLQQLPSEFLAAVWDRSTYILRGSKFGKAGFDPIAVRQVIAELQGLCLEGNRPAARAETVAFNENNMRPTELNTVFKRVGVSDFLQLVGSRNELIAFFGSPDGNVSHGKTIDLLNEFYDKRNDVAHAIGSLRVTGVSDLARFIDFFNCLTDAAVSELNARAGTA